MKIHHFNGIYQERWGFSWAMLVYQRVQKSTDGTINGGVCSSMFFWSRSKNIFYWKIVTFNLKCSRTKSPFLCNSSVAFVTWEALFSMGMSQNASKYTWKSGIKRPSLELGNQTLAKSNQFDSKTIQNNIFSGSSHFSSRQLPSKLIQNPESGASHQRSLHGSSLSLAWKLLEHRPFAPKGMSSLSSLPTMILASFRGCRTYFVWMASSYFNMIFYFLKFWVAISESNLNHLFKEHPGV